MDNYFGGLDQKTYNSFNYNINLYSTNKGLGSFIDLVYMLFNRTLNAINHLRQKKMQTPAAELNR